ncbi:Leucine-rich repeat (LRR) protein [Parabacteroides sp. PF5-5]|uniref:leucine-rich repeat domain-containing protein n=1 Tax=unclassified Parabacteroides TaxID=2649774 RepID=UPI0024738AB2|nr:MULTISPECIES: leucine-rich repeat domain-containing protein [unclassified Parabacteroides]MDH6306951.1 Leucine-rich repeat (LRR) protein [Parabacteroides sp. PH5-39]MDH6317825.1 Leucine-rich repeat (LRR) protein [Parabacteroides sp. PF5-13]MDH6321556.1 Leucine-rich repeat (LRR) protein [Parabacteroides sp. PH5-13]MDH6325368.1 Leucine-rich repeat (LRR) protein [Parabacteroides sp. PH5-8]MDH6329039.1 Leucine-rich repeat (LRR) protein [Parabacteroides sp. PH5-41]
MKQMITLSKRLLIALFVLFATTATALSATHPTYNVNDVNKLKAFLNQTSVEDGKKNWEQIPSDTDPTGWNEDDSRWQTYPGLTWTGDVNNKRITRITWWFLGSDVYKKLAGTVDFTGCTSLSYLDLEATSVTSIDVSGCGSLSNFWASDNTVLETLNCSNTSMNYLDLLGCTNLKTLDCSNNQITSLEIPQTVTTLDCSNNRIPLRILPTGIQNYTYAPQVITISVTTNPVDLSGVATGITSATNASGADIGTLSGDILTLPDGTTGVVEAHITTSDFPAQGANAAMIYTFTVVTGFNSGDITKLQAFLAQESNLPGIKNWERLGMSQDPATLDAGSAAWGSIDGITWVDSPDDMRISEISWTYSSLGGSLDLSGCDSLTVLNCFGNALSSLDVSGCSQLTVLDCSSNALSSLDVSGCSQLTGLSCSGNALSSLDVSGCSQLAELNCYWNYIPLSSLPSVGVCSDYLYAPQYATAPSPLTSPIDLSAIAAGSAIDEASFECLDENGFPISGYSLDNNILTLPAGFTGTVELYISTADFPVDRFGDPALIYNFTVEAGEQPEPESVAVLVALDLVDPDLREHIGLNPVEGTTEMTKGEPFELRVWLDSLTHLSGIAVYLNDQLLDPIRTETRSASPDESLLRANQQVWETVYVYRIMATDDMQIRIVGLSWNDGKNPTGTLSDPSGQGAKVYTTPGYIFIAQGAKPQRENILIYNLNGQLLKSAPAAEGVSRIPVAKGIYIVAIGDNRWKVVVR